MVLQPGHRHPPVLLQVLEHGSHQLLADQVLGVHLEEGLGELFLPGIGLPALLQLEEQLDLIAVFEVQLDLLDVREDSLVLLEFVDEYLVLVVVPDDLDLHHLLLTEEGV